MREKFYKTPREVTPEEALTKLMTMASRAEKCSGDAMKLLKRWGIDAKASEEIIERLIRDKYIDDSRYAAAFVKDKSDYGGWGAFKISQALKIKGVPKDIIDAALETLSESDAHEKLVTILKNKLRTVKASGNYELRGKLFRFALSRGYSYDDIISAIEDLNIETDE